MPFAKHWRAIMLTRDLRRALDPAEVMVSLGLRPDPWQTETLRSQAQRAILLCTRQAGKSTVTGALALHEAIYRPPALVLLLSPSLRQSQELYRKVADFYHALGDPVPTKEESSLRLELENGSRIISLPGKEETIRGYSGVRLLVVDEAARVDDALYYSVRPMLAVSGGRLVALSTPFGKRGWFHQEWTQGGDGWQRVKITAHDCPRISAAFLEEERRSLGEWWFRQEYECQFVETTDQVFTYDEVMTAITPEVKPLFGACNG